MLFPGNPWVYWLNRGLRSLFIKLPKIGDIAKPGVGQNTGDNTRFLRFWWEVGIKNIAFMCQNSENSYSNR